MAEVLLFHHALGLTAGCVAFADRLTPCGRSAPPAYSPPWSDPR